MFKGFSLNCEPRKFARSATPPPASEALGESGELGRYFKQYEV